MRGFTKSETGCHTPYNRFLRGNCGAGLVGSYRGITQYATPNPRENRPKIIYGASACTFSSSVLFCFNLPTPVGRRLGRAGTFRAIFSQSDGHAHVVRDKVEVNDGLLPRCTCETEIPSCCGTAVCRARQRIVYNRTNLGRARRAGGTL